MIRLTPSTVNRAPPEWQRWFQPSFVRATRRLTEKTVPLAITIDVGNNAPGNAERTEDASSIAHVDHDEIKWNDIVSGNEHSSLNDEFLQRVHYHLAAKARQCVV